MNSDQRLLAAAAIVNSALYLACCFVAGIVINHPWSWRLAIASMGVTHLAYVAQLNARDPDLERFIVIASVVLGIASGLTLLW